MALGEGWNIPKGCLFYQVKNLKPAINAAGNKPVRNSHGLYISENNNFFEAA